MGNAVNAGADNGELTDNLCEADYIRTAKIERVFRAVDRGEYILPEHRANAYRDQAWRCNHLHLSAPCIYSEVLEGLGLAPGMSFLNLGSGTGYLSTLVGLILGHSGINHGVEYYDDVIQYANKKLDDFKRYSGAMDEFDFCEPKFMQGNCLCLTSERRYDRVYVGAACPTPFDSYLKNFVKIGGILVMPFHDQLLQVRRDSETSWTASSLLPVSFATLILPKEDNKDTFELMDLQPETLEQLCRTKIRNILRANVEQENPDLYMSANRQPKSPRPKAKATTRRHVCREMDNLFMLPEPPVIIRDFMCPLHPRDQHNHNQEAMALFSEVHALFRECPQCMSEFEERSASATSTASQERESTTTGNASSAGANDSASARSIAMDLTQALMGVSGVSVSPINPVEAAEPTNSASTGGSSGHNGAQNAGGQQRVKSRKIDSGLGDDESNDDDEPTAASGQALKRTKLGWLTRVMKRSFDVTQSQSGGAGSGSGSETEDAKADAGRNKSSTGVDPDGRDEREEDMDDDEPVVLPPRPVYEDDDSSITLDDDSDESPEETLEDTEHYRKRRTVDSPFTELMCKKINELPLPNTLKSFLNFYRF